MAGSWYAACYRHTSTSLRFISAGYLGAHPYERRGPSGSTVGPATTRLMRTTLLLFLALGVAVPAPAQQPISEDSLLSLVQVANANFDNPTPARMRQSLEI